MSIERNQKCPCGSGKKYKKCHGLINEQSSILDKSIPVDSGLNKMLNEGRIKQCIHPDKESCTGKIVKAHSIQNNRVINNIGRDGKVYMVKHNATEYGLDMKFKLIGRSVATTFTGFCGYHDKKIFQSIEDQEYIGSEQQNFLFAYRVFSFEFHKKMEADRVHRKSADKKPSLLEDEQYLSLLEGYNLASKDNLRHKEIFDAAIVNEDYSIIETVSLKIPSEGGVAVCSGFFLEYDINGATINNLNLKTDVMRLLMLTIFPQANETVVLFSWLKEDREFYKNFGEQFSKLTYEEQVQMLNNLIPLYCENVVYNPDFIDKWDKDVKKEYLNVFKYSVGGWLDQKLKRSLMRKTSYSLFNL